MSRPVTSSQGFTLLEILVAVSIFSIMSIIALTGIKTVMDSQTITERAAKQVQELQSTMFYLERDMRHIVDRSIRDEYGDQQDALAAGNTGLQGLTFTRTGIRNPQGLARSSMARVRYWLREKTLVRTQYNQLDRGPDNAVINRYLIDNIDSIDFRFLKSDKQWISFWPPVDAQDTNTTLPRAIEITLEHAKLGNVKRLIPLPY